MGRSGGCGWRGGAHSAEGVEFTEAKERASLAADFTRLKGRILPLSDQARAAGSLRCAGLNDLRRISGASRLKGRSYREYLEAFNEQYAKIEHQPL